MESMPAGQFNRLWPVTGWPLAIAVAVGVVCVPAVTKVVAVAVGRGRVVSTTAWIVLAVVVVAVNSPDDLVAAGILVGLTPLAVALAHIDQSARRLPDVLVLPAYPVVAVVHIVVAVNSGNGEVLLRCAVLAGVCLTAGAVLAAIGAVGFGDAKLAGLLGLTLGWLSTATVIVALISTFVAAALPAVVALIRRGRDADIALGPYLLLGGLAAVVIAG